MLERILRDLKYSVRMLTKSPMFTTAAVATLALGIGLNAATFSAVTGILLRPLGGAENPDELVQVYRAWPGMDYGSTSIPHYQDLRDRGGEAFESTAAWFWEEVSLSADGQPERLMCMLVSANFFQTYGVVPVLGRPFIPGTEDRGPRAHPVIVLGHSYWQTRFGGDPDVVGRTVTLNGAPYEIVGVAPEDFKGPVTYADIPVYIPLMMQPAIGQVDVTEARGSNSMTTVGRLADGVSIERAEQVLDGILVQLKEEFPGELDTQLGHTLVSQSDAGIHPMFRSAQVGMSAVMMVVVALLLLIACVNVANLFLARARERRREMGVRISLGASSGAIVRQLLTESLVFSAVAGLAGLGLAAVATRVLGQVRPPIDGPWAFQVALDTSVLWFTLIVSVVAGILFGLAPALQAAKPDTVAAVKGASADRPGRSRVSSGLVVVQMALSLLLLISSGLFLRSLQGATRIDPGFDDPGGLALTSLDPLLQGYDEARSREFHERLLEEVNALPEVRVAGLTTTLPLGLSGSDRDVDIPGYEFAEGEMRYVRYAQITEGYFEAMGIRLAEGRGFDRRDNEDAPHVLIINQRFAERFWPGEPALGKVVRLSGEEHEVVGVVATGKYQSLGEDPTEYMYLPERKHFRSSVSVVARTNGAPDLALRRIRETVRALDPDMPVYDVRTMEDHMGLALLPARLGGSVLGMFGILGLILAAVGIYGVMAYSVAQRTKEIGVRVALGADRGRLVRLVLREGMKLAVIGTVLGLLAAAAAARLVSGMLYNVSSLDPVAFVGVPLLLTGVAALAVYLPARRAARLDPIRALKTE
ncbi:MAG: ABC transporter permease [Gemmatimonadota bacterium]|nr:ABC transporter permease [Gemmatimonadota bacterium]